MSCIAFVVLLYLALDVAGAGKAGCYSAVAPEPWLPGWRALQFVFVAVRRLWLSLLVLARSGSILVWRRLEATRVPLRREGLSSFLGSWALPVTKLLLVSRGGRKGPTSCTAAKLGESARLKDPSSANHRSRFVSGFSRFADREGKREKPIPFIAPGGHSPNTVVKARGFSAFDPARGALQAEGVLGGFHRLLESIFERYKS